MILPKHVVPILSSTPNPNDVLIQLSKVQEHIDWQFLIDFSKTTKRFGYIPNADPQICKGIKYILNQPLFLGYTYLLADDFGVAAHMLLQSPTIIKLRQFSTSTSHREFAERTNNIHVANQWKYKTGDLLSNGPWDQDFFLKRTTTTRNDGTVATWQETPDTIIYYGKEQLEWFEQATFSPLTNLIGINEYGRVNIKTKQNTNIP